MAKLRITRDKGFHLEMESGLVLSVQIGGGNYCDNYDEPLYSHRAPQYRLPPSATAEIAAWFQDLDMLELASGDTVAGYVKVDAIFAAIPALMATQDRDRALQIINGMLKEPQQ